MDYTRRIEGVRGLLSRENARAALITRGDSIRYLTGFSGSLADMVVTPDLAILATDGRYALAARERAFPGLEVHVGTQGIDQLPEVADRYGVAGRVIFDAEGVAVSRYTAWLRSLPAAEFVPVEGLLDDLRAVKDPDELALIRKACAITDQAWEEIQKELRPGVTEISLAQRLISIQIEMGAEASAFPPIVASGPNSAFPHHHPGRRTLSEGDLVKVDFGAIVEGYGSDLTRTVVLGEPTEEMCRIYDLVLRAQAAGCAALHDGVTGDEVDRAARSIIEEGGYGPRFSHGLGHGLGLAKDPPHVRPGYRLATGNVVSIEPGVYIEGMGGVRIEDLLVVTETGSEYLSHAPIPPRLSPPGWRP
jgi:Xaa-Pro aminopeptidase